MADDFLSVEQYDLVNALVVLRNKISELVIQAIADGAANCEWAELADILDGAATLCRREVVLVGESADRPEID